MLSNGKAAPFAPPGLAKPGVPLERVVGRDENIVAPKLGEELGQTVIIENKVGAGGSLAALSVIAAPPDGYTLLVGASGAMSIIPAISVKPPYATLKDFAPISNLASFPLILSVYPSHPAKNVQELVSWMKANPDKANYATASSAFTLATELFKLRTGAPAAMARTATL